MIRHRQISFPFATILFLNLSYKQTEVIAKLVYKMEINYIQIAMILLMALQAKCMCYVGSKEMDAQCASYCYHVVKPLLQFADSAKSQPTHLQELQNKIKYQAVIILNLNETINQRKSQLTEQQELIESYKILNQNLQKIIAQNEDHINKLQSEIRLKDNAINDLQSELGKKESHSAVKIKKLENEITAYKQTSSCFGKMTELHTIEVHNSKPKTFIVSCDSNLAGSGWTVIQRRMDGSVNFNRTWLEYKEGFGNLRGEFFIGLEKLHLLTKSQPHELYISLMDFANETRFARYNNFNIGSEEEFYELKILGAFSGTVSDSFTPHKSIKFSTPDKNNDINNKTCAATFGSGWWFHNCFHSNLNGKYRYIDANNTFDCIEWRGWKKDRPLKFTQMMIKPIYN